MKPVAPLLEHGTVNQDRQHAAAHDALSTPRLSWAELTVPLPVPPSEDGGSGCLWSRCICRKKISRWQKILGYFSFP